MNVRQEPRLARRPLVVVDASVTLKWVLPETADEAWIPDAMSLLDCIDRGDARILQPSHWLAETAAVVARLYPDDAEDIVETLELKHVQVADGPQVLRRACRLAVTLNHHLFDTLYHSVALEHGGVLVTADERYERKSRDIGRVVALRDWQLALSG